MKDIEQEIKAAFRSKHAHIANGNTKCAIEDGEAPVRRWYPQRVAAILC